MIVFHDHQTTTSAINSWACLLNLHLCSASLGLIAFICALFEEVTVVVEASRTSPPATPDGFRTLMLLSSPFTVSANQMNWLGGSPTRMSLHDIPSGLIMDWYIRMLSHMMDRSLANPCGRSRGCVRPISTLCLGW